ncbi:protein-L-isoaspartate O-methyltransferase family protein [Sulfurisphaera ohwakuensis]|uniref:protein-L-isoaspartate(D-aspartate) O-methyltransferase n=1 Tax=Sulfurisphaera ohwakuensis TaxID=69656 RepID=A0A650CFN5_SULOH|nr:protein-L-isoaspartate O-methyltransferase [Sulfurisphaera ohwakuensis]MBB5254973.1 protein-L-isoaspartate(D-aspartate) O-methyltransferase [Sulfurisphaera ohwakuensis]QGR16634.1 protein-L-isoaspartate O-methyltransferase [Sulfurisphaera ohwakuensis]
MSEKEEILRKIKTRELAEAFNKVDRSLFLPENLKDYAYTHVNEALPILPGINTTALNLGIFMLDELDLHKGQKVLEIGTGIGYYTALIAEIVDKVVSVEINEKMYNYASKLLSSYHNIKLILGDGTLGYEEEKPYDRAIVWATAPTLLCKPYEQLKDGGIMILPIGVGRVQKLYKVIKKGNNPSLENLGEVMFGRIGGLYGFYDDYDDIEFRVNKLERQIKSILDNLVKKT